jgi:hypothetical protein
VNWDELPRCLSLFSLLPSLRFLCLRLGQATRDGSERGAERDAELSNVTHLRIVDDGPVLVRSCLTPARPPPPLPHGGPDSSRTTFTLWHWVRCGIALSLELKAELTSADSLALSLSRVAFTLTAPPQCCAASRGWRDLTWCSSARGWATLTRWILRASLYATLCCCFGVDSVLH